MEILDSQIYETFDLTLRGFDKVEAQEAPPFRGGESQLLFQTTLLGTCVAEINRTEIVHYAPVDGDSPEAIR